MDGSNGFTSQHGRNECGQHTAEIYHEVESREKCRPLLLLQYRMLDLLLFHTGSRELNQLPLPNVIIF